MASPVLARLAAALLASEKGRKTVGWVIALILSPLILLTAFLCCFGTAAVEHNDFAVSASFYGPAFSDKIPVEYKITSPRCGQLLPFWMRRQPP